jgi:hypothetical protein
MIRKLHTLTLLILAVALLLPAPPTTAAQPASRFFAETGHGIQGRVLAYWDAHGGLAQQGYPLSDEFTEISPLDNKPYTVQYFERAVFEYHPEYAGTPYEVLPAQLGAYRQRAVYPTPRLPIPFTRGYLQSAPHGSDRYLIWHDGPVAGPTPPDLRDLRVLDLQTLQPITVGGPPGIHTGARLAGSRVVWGAQDTACPECGSDVWGQDLAGGDPFPIASGPAHQGAPAVAGHTVVWYEWEGTETHLMRRDLAGGVPMVIATITETSVLYAPEMSEEYVVWGGKVSNRYGSYFKLWAYNLQTGQEQVVAEVGGISDGWNPVYTLADHRVLWSDYYFRLADLQTGAQTVLLERAISGPAIQGDTVVWAGSTDLGPSHIWGMRLADRIPIQLTSGDDGQGYPTIAGSWLVWENYTGPYSGRLNSMPLAAAFAAGTPRPLPTATPPRVVP